MIIAKKGFRIIYSILMSRIGIVGIGLIASVVFYKYFKW